MFVGHNTRSPTDEGYVRAHLRIGVKHKPNPFPDTIVPAQLMHSLRCRTMWIASRVFSWVVGRSTRYCYWKLIRPKWSRQGIRSGCLGGSSVGSDGVDYILNYIPCLDKGRYCIGF
jgi:hypothetical protein